MTAYQSVQKYLDSIHLPRKDSHKGENGKLLLIGGSELFHAASAWSLSIASRIVDMVFYSSVPENNALIVEAKKHFWDGVVVPRGDVESYLKEADCVLIGPGMTRDEKTTELTNTLLQKYPTKKWVIDAGALQMVNPSLLTSSMIITPHHQEFLRVFGVEVTNEKVMQAQSKKYGNVVILVKGPTDYVVSGDQLVSFEGGNEGMTKGGTGDVLAGLVAALYCTNEAFSSAVVGSFLNKKAGEALYASVGPFFNATDLVGQLPKTMAEILVSSS
ncbi:MAG: NAD(P)H-hydrate dehydratase [Candidatus Pacebacteria bacterium]|nr:NAD(P)H-hydrate dehydratase [Candidatus Paceibacterota bacterium]